MYNLKSFLVVAIHFVTIYHLPLVINCLKVSSSEGSIKNILPEWNYYLKKNNERINYPENNPKNLSLKIEDFVRQVPKLDYVTTGISIATNLATISLGAAQIITGQKTLAALKQLSQKLDTEFSALKSNIVEIRKQLEEVHWVIPYYQDFELALRNVLLDIEFPPPNDPEIYQKRGLYLHDQLRTFIQGMLGTNIVLGDIVATIFKRQEKRAFCDADKIDDDLRPFYDMIKLGAIGLGYYGDKIGQAFNIEARARRLDQLKTSVLSRVNTTIKKCVGLGKKCISSYVRRILTQMIKVKYPDYRDIIGKIYDRMEDLYGGPRNTSVPGEFRNISWLFRITENLDPSTVSIKFSVEGSEQIDHDLVVVEGFAVYWFNDWPSFTKVKSRNFNPIDRALMVGESFPDGNYKDILNILTSKSLVNGNLPVQTIHQYLPFDNKQCQNSTECSFGPGVTCCKNYIKNRFSMIYFKPNSPSFHSGTMPYLYNYFSFKPERYLFVILGL